MVAYIRIIAKTNHSTQLRITITLRNEFREIPYSHRTFPHLKYKSTLPSRKQTHFIKLCPPDNQRTSFFTYCSVSSLDYHPQLFEYLNIDLDRMQGSIVLSSLDDHPGDCMCCLETVVYALQNMCHRMDLMCA